MTLVSRPFFPTTESESLVNYVVQYNALFSKLSVLFFAGFVGCQICRRGQRLHRKWAYVGNW